MASYAVTEQPSTTHQATNATCGRIGGVPADPGSATISPKRRPEGDRVRCPGSPDDPPPGPGCCRSPGGWSSTRSGATGAPRTTSQVDPRDCFQHAGDRLIGTSPRPGMLLDGSGPPNAGMRWF